jgi:dihydroneopterin aldolase
VSASTKPDGFDELGDTVDYGHVLDAVAAAVRQAKDVLRERLAARVADIALAFGGVPR